MALFQPAAPRLVDAVLDEVELLGAMRVGVNGDLRADFSGPKQMEIVQVKTVGLSVQLDGHVMFFCRMKDLLEIDRKRLAFVD